MICPYTRHHLGLSRDSGGTVVSMVSPQATIDAQTKKWAYHGLPTEMLDFRAPRSLGKNNLAVVPRDCWGASKTFVDDVYPGFS